MKLLATLALATTLLAPAATMAATASPVLTADQGATVARSGCDTLHDVLEHRWCRRR